MTPSVNFLLSPNFETERGQHHWLQWYKHEKKEGKISWDFKCWPFISCQKLINSQAKTSHPSHTHSYLCICIYSHLHKWTRSELCVKPDAPQGPAGSRSSAQPGPSASPALEQGPAACVLGAALLPRRCPRHGRDANPPDTPRKGNFSLRIYNPSLIQIFSLPSYR